jgi:D-alanine--poly(phosphoribitol) ligase subunit 1
VTRPYYTAAGQLFRAVADRHADRRALIWTGSDATTYTQLDRLSNQIARVLLERGVRKREPVCLCLEKDLFAYAAILGCLKIGAPYFVVDPANPAARTRNMLERTRPALAFVHATNDPSVFASPTVSVEDSRGPYACLERVADDPVHPGWTIDGSDPAYIMFTSGSTGVPKGVTISHDNLVHFIAWSQHEFSTEPDDVFTGLNPLFFDNSVFDTYASLFAGAALAPFSASVMREAKALVARIDDMGCTVYFSVPSLLVYLQTMKLVSTRSFPSLTKVIFGGEGYPKPMLARLFDAIGARASLFNVYGPTECTCICSVYPLSSADFREPVGLAPLGRLIPNFSHVIVDAGGREVLPGDVGELCLGGPCVGLGYYGDAALSGAAFIQNPTHSRFFDRMYKTGDLVRLDPVDGKMYFIGRADSQIKHQGYRIELGEIEQAMLTVDGVNEAAAVYVRSGIVGRIVGVVGSTAELAPEVVRSAVRQILPAYMVPDRVMVVPQLMKNANGKVDRNAIVASLTEGQDDTPSIHNQIPSDRGRR